MTAIDDIVRSLDRLDDAKVVVTLPTLTAGRFRRRNVRTFLAAAQLGGLDVAFHEERGWLDSVFVIRIEGQGWLIRRHLRRLLALTEETR